MFCAQFIARRYGMSSPAAELAVYKSLGGLGVTMFAAVPPLMAVIEPATWSDVEARMLYIGIAILAAGVVLTFYQPKTKKEASGRIAAAAVMCLAFVEPLAFKIEPYVRQSSLPGVAPIAAAFPAAVFLGICGWWIVGSIAWFVRSPLRILRLIEWWRGKIPAQLVFADDPELSGTQPTTNTNGAGQLQPGNGVTLTPAQDPVKTVVVLGITSEESSKKTTG